jgi:CRP/FNR family transcriptional regulator, dissimilatory nitrate respiration regulator
LIQETQHRIDEILSRQPLFRGLGDEELARIALGCREFRVRKGEVLFNKGDDAEGMHVVVMGQFKLTLPSPQGSEKVVHMCGPGSTFGEAVVFLDKPYPVGAQATTESIVLMVGKRVLLSALEESTMLSRKMLASLSARLHELLGDMETCMLRGSVQRVVCFLIQCAPEGDEPGFSVTLPASKQSIASRLNLAPETFSRVLSELSERGLIEVRGRVISVADRQALRDFTA